MEEKYLFLLKQHIGTPSIPLVREKDLVLRGQQIGKAGDGLSVPLYSSINGIVQSVTSQYIAIKKTDTDFSRYQPLKGTCPLELIQESGLTGLGGAGFPTYKKLETKLSPMGRLLINGAECEPILSHNLERMEKSLGEFIQGIYIALEILKIKKATIGIKKKHNDLIETINSFLESQKKEDFEINVFPLEDLYPMGEERAFVREVTGILLSPEDLPQKTDVVVINAETAYRIYEAVIKKKPFLDKDLTIGGKLFNDKNASVKVLFDLPLGSLVKSVFQTEGGLSMEYGEILMGGPYTGKRVSLEDSIEKTTGGLIASECFFKGPEKIGLLICACGAKEERMKEIADSLNSEVVLTTYCKQAIQQGAGYKCENPGKCPGQVQKILEMKKAGATGVLMGNCTDCSNTVMSCAPKLGFAVFHCTDQALRAVNQKLIRKYKG